jgi:hypothetical protein
LREAGKKVFMRRIARPVESTTPETVEYIRAQTQEDIRKLAPYVRMKEENSWI